MRVLHVIGSPSAGGAEIYVKNMAERLVRRGCHVTVGYISEAEDLKTCESFGRRFKQELANRGVSVVSLGHECRRNPLLGGVRLRRLISSVRPDVLHSHLYYGVLFYLFSFARIPLVYTHHNIVLGKGRFLLPLFDRVVDRYVAISNACEKVLRRHVRGPVRLIYNGIPIEDFECRDRGQPSRREKVHLIAVGRLSRQKNHRFLIEALRGLDADPATRHKWRCEIVGEGSEEGSLRRAVAWHGLEGSVALLGNRDDIPARLCDADLFVMCSRYEGFPIALIEAAAAGLPAVATDVGGCGEIIGTDPGVLPPEGDLPAFVQALKTMISDEERRRGAAHRNRKAASRFDIEAAVGEHLALYESVIPNGTSLRTIGVADSGRMSL